jgi:chorismate mutase
MDEKMPKVTDEIWERLKQLQQARIEEMSDFEKAVGALKAHSFFTATEEKIKRTITQFPPLSVPEHKVDEIFKELIERGIIVKKNHWYEVPVVLEPEIDTDNDD